ncbi:MAG: hypothetical protein PQJ59_05290 [Spirochaetales bacterium]|nr:hypothetical protein [Spirochaetales bacterium]
MTSIILPVGPVSLRLRTEEEGFIEALKEYFIGSREEGKEDLLLDLQIKENKESGPVPNSLYLTKKMKGREIYTGNGLIKILPGKTSLHFQLQIDPLILKGGYIRVFEQIFYQAALTAIKSTKKKVHLIHSSSVKKGDFTYMFVGKSEAGKSTAAQLSSAYHILNDEISIIEEREDTLYLYGSPFNGLFREKKPGDGPLRAILLLRQAQFHKLTKADKGEAIKTLAHEIIPPLGLEDFPRNDTYLTMLDQATNLYGKVPHYHMDFLPDSGFWEEIKKEFERET